MMTSSGQSPSKAVPAMKDQEKQLPAGAEAASAPQVHVPQGNGHSAPTPPLALRPPSAAPVSHHAPALNPEPPVLLRYRPWRGQLRGTWHSVWPIARIALVMMFQRKLFWVLYGLSLLFFLMFFFGQYLLAYAETQMGLQAVPILGLKIDRNLLIQKIRESLRIDGSGMMYRIFFWYQGWMVMVVLALAGSLLVGNDFRFGSLPFYLSKPLGRRHYLIGKCLAVAVFVNLMTTVPAVILYVQYGLLTEWSYFTQQAPLLVGIFGYGLVLTVCLSLLLVATASWLRKTVPLIMAWTTLFVFLRLLASALVDGLDYHPRWRLIDLWNNTYVVGNACLGMAPSTLRPPTQPAVFEASLVLVSVCVLCMSYLSLQIRAVEIVK